jgi:ATP-dependent RNA helicase DeaD
MMLLSPIANSCVPGFKPPEAHNNNNMTFEELGIAPHVLKAIHELGFENPMPVQEEVIPLMLGGTRDIIALAQTGTGKTAAFGLPLIQEADPSIKDPQALILCPTRELCVQITKDLEAYARFSNNIHIQAVYGGASILTQMSALKRGVQIVVATPGRMIDLIERKAVKLSSVRRVVLDEADEMLNMGFQDSINAILAKVPDGRNTLLFSATMPDGIVKISKKYMKEPLEVTIGVKNAGAENVRHICYTVHAKDKYFVLKRIADYNPGIYGIVFCRTRRETQEIADKLIQDGYNADALHGDLSQGQRDSVMQKVRTRNVKLLVATDVAARGLDVDDLTHVINFGLPDDYEIYTHRSGRTGRAGKMGTSVVIVNLKEKSGIRQIERMIKKTFQHVAIPTGQEICEKQLFHLIDRMEKVDTEQSGIEGYLPAIYKKLEWLDKEEIIRRFLSLEFNRFLDYYKDARDISAPDEYKSGKGERSHADRQDKGQFSRMFINLGRVDGLKPGDLIHIINTCTPGMKVGIGRIELQKTHSFFEVEARYIKQVIALMKKAHFRDRQVQVGTADDQQSFKPRSENFVRKDNAEQESYKPRPEKVLRRDTESKPSYAPLNENYSRQDREFQIKKKNRKKLKK